MDEICASSAGARVQLLVRKLESQIPNGEAKRKKTKPEAFFDIGKISAGRACGQAPLSCFAGRGLSGGESGPWGHRLSAAEKILRRGPFLPSQKVPPLPSGGVWESLSTLGPQFPHLLKGSHLLPGAGGRISRNRTCKTAHAL